jgi:hypothetical protein
MQESGIFKKGKYRLKMAIQYQKFTVGHWAIDPCARPETLQPGRNREQVL